MTRMILSSLLALGLLLSGLTLQLSTASAADDEEAGGDAACVRTKFDTKMTEDACKKGGQKEAKKAWKAWQKEAKKAGVELSCKSCHTKLAPEFPLKPDALEQFKKAGGK